MCNYGAYKRANRPCSWSVCKGVVSPWAANGEHRIEPRFNSGLSRWIHEWLGKIAAQEWFGRGLLLSIKMSNLLSVPVLRFLTFCFIFWLKTCISFFFFFQDWSFLHLCNLRFKGWNSIFRTCNRAFWKSVCKDLIHEFFLIFRIVLIYWTVSLNLLLNLIRTI